MWFFLYYYFKGLKLMSKHAYLEAIKQFEKCLVLSKNNLHNLGLIYLRLGSSYFDINVNDKAKYYFLKGLEINPEDKDDILFGTGAEVSSRLGVIYAEEGDYNKAEQYLKNAIKCKPKHIPARSYTNWEMVDKYLEYLDRIKKGTT